MEDRLLVYLWLKPVPRWQLPAAAILATASVLVPLTALPVAATALAAGAPEVAPAALLAASLAGLAYAGVFVAAGLWFRRAAWWGLAFVLLWENAVAQLAEGSARFTIVGWARSVLVDRSRHRGVALGRIRWGCIRGAPRRCSCRLARCDVAVQAGGRRLNG